MTDTERGTAKGMFTARNVLWLKAIQTTMISDAKQTVITTERQVSGNMTIDEAIAEQLKAGGKND